jgi:hypothetical protein
MRTARALERHLEEDIVARHGVTISRTPSVASGRALNAPHTPGEVVEGEGEVVTRVFVSAKVLVGCKSRSTLFKSGAYGQKDTGLDEPLKFVTTFPYRSEETEALGWRDVIVRACGRDERRTPRTSSRRVRRRGCSPCRFARRWGHASRRTNGTQPSTAQYPRAAFLKHL